MWRRILTVARNKKLSEYKLSKNQIRNKYDFLKSVSRVSKVECISKVKLWRSTNKILYQ